MDINKAMKLKIGCQKELDVFVSNTNIILIVRITSRFWEVDVSAG